MTQDNPTISAVLARWLLGVETAAKDLVAPSTIRLDSEAAPSGDLDRLWAATAHLGVFGGAWLLAPLVVYLLKRGNSAFVRWHSFQALVLALWTLCTGVLSLILVAVGILVFVVLEKLGLGRAGSAIVALSAAPFAFIMLFSVSLSAIGGIKSLAGKPWTMPIIGRIARGVLARGSLPTEPNAALGDRSG